MGTRRHENARNSEGYNNAQAGRRRCTRFLDYLLKEKGHYKPGCGAPPGQEKWGRSGRLGDVRQQWCW